jgi:ATP-dependent RNA helicase HelY
VEYAALRRRLSEREAELSRSGARARKAGLVQSLEALKPGDVIRVSSGRRAGLAVVLDAGLHPRDDPHPLVVTEAKWGGRLSVLDFRVPVAVLGHVRLPKHAEYRSPQVRRDIASSLRALDIAPEAPARRRDRASQGDDADVLELRAALRTHPCHGCHDREQHMRWAERRSRLERENEDLHRRMEGRVGSLGRRFDRICTLLQQLGYLDGDRTTDAGRQLSRIWSESDLVISECLRGGAWDGLEPAELAAVASTVVYEPRREERPMDRMPSGAVRAATDRTFHIWGQLAEDEEAVGLTVSREPETGLVWALYRWARGDRLDLALAAASQGDTELSGGDFVRWCKQVLDLLEQLAGVTAADGRPVPVAEVARRAAAAVRRGVVAQSMQT